MYCAVNDIKSDFKGIEFSADTAVTQTKLEEWIEDESNYIDARIGLRYQTPVDSNDYPEAYSLLKRICIFRVSERVRNVIEIKRGETQNQSDEKQSENSVRKQKTDLDMIVDGSLLLKNVPLLNSQGTVSSFAIDNCGENIFDVNKQQW